MDNAREHMLNGNQVDDNSDNDSNNDEDDMIDEEDYDANIKDDILRPASTRSKIVVNLKESKEGISYELDKYDKVRMQLLLPDQKLYKCYLETIREITTNIKYQPRKRSLPCYRSIPAFLGQWLIILAFVYIFFLII